MYDTIIIGAGISGLSAAWQLKDRNVLLLEKDSVPGGRIKTRTWHGTSYDMGAVFGFPAASLPFPLQSELIDESPLLALWYQGRIYFGAGVISCIAEVNSSLRSEARTALLELSNGRQPDYENMTPESRQILNAFFQVIHPGEMKDYVLPRQIDAFRKFDSSHFARGNRVVIEAFLGELTSTPCQLQLNTIVTAVEQEGDCVLVACLQNDTPTTFYAKTVIITTPAPVVLKVVRHVDEPCRTFLNSLRYGCGVVVALGLKDAAIPEFSYLVTPDLTTNTIVRQHTPDPDVNVLIVYYTGGKAHKLQTENDRAILDDAVTALRTIGIGPDKADSLIFSDIHRWEHLGPVITPEIYSDWNPDAAKPMARVFLGGEYTYVEKQNPMPYGMIPAAASGVVQAHAVQKFLETESAAAGFSPEFLTDVYIYELTDNRPVFLEHREEGTIAFYGLILQATKDMQICRYLLDCSVGGLWEYQHGFGATAEDTALVLEGLLSVKVPAATLLPHLKKLIETFYNSEEGAFHTILRGRAVYWNGPSVDATGLAGYLLHCTAPEEFHGIITACRSYLLQTQELPGYWSSKWFPSTIIPTWYAVRLLSPDYQAGREAVERAVNYTLDKQSPDGSWNSSIIDTSVALLILKTVKRLQPENEKKYSDLRQGIENAAAWLLLQHAASGRRGEPVLYYWFEQKPEYRDLFTESRLFYHCADKGPISAAWAKLALAAL